MLVRAAQILPELVRDQKQDRRLIAERLSDGVVTDPLVREPGRGDDLHGVESRPGHVDAVERGEVGEFLEGDGFGGGIRQLDLAADFV